MQYVRQEKIHKKYINNKVSNQILYYLQKIHKLTIILKLNQWNLNWA